VDGPALPVVKTLFALSCNICAFSRCEERLTDPAWRETKADIAHIRGKRPGSPRYDTNMTDDERHAFENLLLLCPNHHRLVDRLSPEAYSVQMLEEMKARHEEHCRETHWASEEDLDRYARLALDAVGGQGARGTRGDLTVERALRPRLRIEKSGRDQINVVNYGEADAFRPVVEPLDAESDQAFVRSGEPPARLSPGARWQAGIHAATFGNAGTHVLALRWEDGEGRQYEGEFPL
jgi:hypothetical protein